MTAKDSDRSIEEGAGFELKPLSRDAVPRALERADRYRLLNEPREAESICLDILGADPGNQKAVATLLLALTDQFARVPGIDIARARALLPQFREEQFREEHDRAYYSGVVCERWAKARLAKGELGHIVHSWFEEAMTWYEKAEDVKPAGNEDAILRWNACVRILMRDERLKVVPREAPEAGVLDDDEAPTR
jgi:hypothetical protein